MSIRAEGYSLRALSVSSTKILFLNIVFVCFCSLLTIKFSERLSAILLIVVIIFFARYLLTATSKVVFDLEKKSLFLVKGCLLGFRRIVERKPPVQISKIMFYTELGIFSGFAKIEFSDGETWKLPEGVSEAEVKEFSQVLSAELGMTINHQTVALSGKQW